MYLLISLWGRERSKEMQKRATETASSTPIKGNAIICRGGVGGAGNEYWENALKFLSFLVKAGMSSNWPQEVRWIRK